MQCENKKKIVSYSLFFPRQVYSYRDWDSDKFNRDRYWFNLPALTLINKILYPDYGMHMYICKGTFSNPLFSFYQELSRINPRYGFSIVDEEYNGHEPAMWRLLPMWDPEVEVFLSRDIDSVPNREEYSCVKLFEESPFAVHTIRAHENHHSNRCKMLIGLSSFKPKLLPPEIIKDSLENFKKAHAPLGEWDADQVAIIEAFTKKPEFTSLYFLDSAINNQSRPQAFPCHYTELSGVNDIELSELASSVFDLVKEFKLTTWAGQPCDSRGDFLKRLIEITSDEETKGILLENEILKNFYLNV